MRFHNSLTRTKDEFAPIDPTHVRMYVCGPTVYDRVHIGNARPVVVFDTLYRLLEMKYGRVTYVRNITDVDDKINARAAESGISINQLTAETTEYFHEDMAALNALLPTVEPKATEHISEMIEMIKTLIEKGYAYEAEGHVLFAVAKDPSYGVLSGRNREDMIAGARVEVAPYKQDPADFVLWKPSEEGIPGWESPWGFGRPGWHIECSAMSGKYLGETFDIHGGGADLMFPHHENEIAQSTCANGQGTFAKVWLHNGMITVEGEKMSKSLGNFITVRDALNKYPGELIRYVLLSSHYRQALDWNHDTVGQAQSCLNRLYTALRDAPDDLKPTISDDVISALEDDINTPLALSKMFEICSQVNKAKSVDRKREFQALLKGSGHVLGLLYLSSDAWFKGTAAEDAEEIEAMIDARIEAREAKDFKRADEIRDALLAKGLILEDTPSGTLWRKK